MFRQPGRPSHDPEKCAGVEQQSHDLPSKASSSSSGNGLKNDFVILSLFFARPIGRLVFLAGATARISATGVFLLHRRMVSPSDSRSRYFERWVLAWWTFSRIIVHYRTKY